MIENKFLFFNLKKKHIHIPKKCYQEQGLEMGSNINMLQPQLPHLI